MLPNKINANRWVALGTAVLALGLMAPPEIAAERRSSGGDRGKSTASRGSSSGGQTATRSSSSAGRGSRASARSSRGSSGSASSGTATRAAQGTGSGSGQQVAVGRATYGHGSYGGGYGYPYYHYRPYYFYPSWSIGSYGWAYYDSPSIYFATVGWPYAWSNYCWPAYYNAWAFSGSGRPPLDDSSDRVDRERAGVVELDVAPKKATVILNGNDIGQAKDYNGRWDELYLAPGIHRIDLEYPGYQTFRVYLEVREGREYRVEEQLQRGEGMDTRSMPEPKLPAPKRPQEYKVQDGALDPDEQPDAAPMPLPRAKKTELDFEGFEPPQLESPTLQRGLLRVNIQPADAAVYLDGEFLARAGELSRLHGALPVAAGTHRIQVTHPDHRTETVTVDVEAGKQPAEINLRLRRN